MSLLASGTEIVCALGAGRSLVGRSHECHRPSWVRSLPPCTRPAFDVSGSSGEIDAEVKRRMRTGEPMYHVDAELIDRLEADVLIAQTHCEVCAVTADDARRAGGDKGRNVVALQAGTLSGIYEDIRAVGRAIPSEHSAEDVVAGLQARIDAVRAATADKAKRRVCVLEWTVPLFVAGNWMPELLEAANASPAIAVEGPYSSIASWQHVIDADPDVMIVAPCGFDLERTALEAAGLESLPGWDDLRAVHEGNVAFADGNAYFNRSGPTIGDTAEILAEIVHAVGERFYGEAWLRYDDVRPTAAITRMHARACADGASFYTDPASGYQVMTADFLRRRGYCCGNGCRHCPHGSDGARPALREKRVAG